MDDIVDEPMQAPAPTIYDSFGHSISPAGDVNGDGLAVDLCRVDESKAFLRFGEAFRSTITGTVTDSSTNSLQGATLSASISQSNRIDASGEYTLNTMPAGNPIVTTSTDGYVDRSLTAVGTDGDRGRGLRTEDGATVFRWSMLIRVCISPVYWSKRTLINRPTTTKVADI